jgi:hypothetical protein
MIERNVTLPEMILWTGTRVALGAGIGMLISRRLTQGCHEGSGISSDGRWGDDDPYGDLHHGKKI